MFSILDETAETDTGFHVHVYSQCPDHRMHGHDQCPIAFVHDANRHLLHTMLVILGYAKHIRKSGTSGISVVVHPHPRNLVVTPGKTCAQS